MTRSAKSIGAEWFAIVAAVAAIVALVAGSSDPSGPTVSLEPVAGFSASEPQGNDRARWVMENPAEGRLIIAQRPTSGHIVLRVWSFRQPRRVAVRVANGPSTTAVVPTAGVTAIRLDVSSLAQGQYRLRISTSPGPESLAGASGGTDARTVSLRMLEPLAAGGATPTSRGQTIATGAWWILMLAGLGWFLSLVWRASRMRDDAGRR